LRNVNEGDDLYQLSNKLKQYKGFVVNSINGLNNSLSFINGITLEVGQASGEIDQKHLRRIQIREAIRSHLEKRKSFI